jgi:signal transduction histidine kinase
VLQSIPIRPLLAAFGDFLLANQEEITRRWVTAVDRSPDIAASEDLTYRQLLDHLPQMCQELAETLKKSEHETNSEPAARAHGRKRWEQGYRLQELIREVCLLRRNFIDTWPDAFATANPLFDVRAQQASRRLVGRFFDDVIIDSTVQFVEEQTDVLRSTQSALETEKRAAADAKSHVLRHVGHSLREPLGAIVFAAEALLSEKQLTAEGLNMVRIVLRNAKLETENVEELLLGAELFLKAKADG